MIRTIILDDEKIIRKGIQKIIRENLPELEVTASLQNGRECLEYLEISGADLIISDIRMPYVDGLELLKTLRNRGQQTDVFLISGFDDFDYCRTALKYGAQDYLLKPIDKNDFIRSLRAYIDRCDENRAGNRVDVKLNEDDRRTIREIKKYLRNHFSQDITLKELSDKFYMNPSYISQLFKKETGVTITEYLIRIKMEMAGIMLKDPAVRISDVSAQVGYKNPKQFASMFKKVMGLTPSQYRDHFE
ncbi:response regulator transcription factor [Diplocloster modestus]|uniref:Stage 0 sporulation protein A homolog n=1 Tax=Diplocloster modestus TaxID=2850322 RepID=A0ABS6KDP1_9FIRM|nr:response regulator [Diplocloster modestus]